MEEAQPNSGERGGRILLVDSHDVFCQTTTEALAQQQYSCTSAADVSVAAELLQHGSYDVLIVECEIPGNADFTFVRSVSRLAPGLPVIALTAHASLESAVAALQLPIVAYLLKPVAPDDLLAAVQTALPHARFCQALRDMQERLQEWKNDVQRVTFSAEGGRRSPAFSTARETYFMLTLRHIAGCLTDLKSLMALPVPQPAHSLEAGPALDPPSAASTSLDARAMHRLRRLEQTLFTIAADLAAAGITTQAAVPTLQPRAVEELRSLSPREGEVLRSLLTGQRVPSIARSLYLSPHTVRNHLKAIFRKLGVRSQTELLERFKHSETP